MRWERDVTHFSGYAGEVIRGVIYPGIWLTLIPVFFLWFAYLIIFTVLLNMAPKLADPLGPILAYCISSFIVGRFAVGASQGDVNSGFLNMEIDFGEPIFFVFRSFVFLLIWQLPLYGIIELTGLGLKAPSFAAATGDFTAVLLLFLFVVMLLGFPMSWLLASATSNFAEIFSKDSWEYVFNTRRRDIPIYLAAVIGGSLLFLMIYCIPCLYIGKGMVTFVVSLSVTDPMAAEMLIALFSWMAIPIIPGIVSGVIVGRLCGAFVQGLGTFDEGVQGSQDEAIAAASSVTNSSVTNKAGSHIPSALQDTSDSQVRSEAIEIEQILPEDDPSDEVVKWAKALGGEVNEVLSVSVLRYSGEGTEESQIGLAVQIDVETKLSRQQEIKKTISGKASPGKILFVTPHNEKSILGVATLLYRRK